MTLWHPTDSSMAYLHIKRSPFIQRERMHNDGQALSAHLWCPVAMACTLDYHCGLLICKTARYMPRTR